MLERVEFGDYELIKRLAVGGMGEVFLARQTRGAGFDRYVAIKRILPELTDDQEFVWMFIDEARLASRLNHPNIVQIHDLGLCGNQYFIAMEFLEGRDLRRVMSRLGSNYQALPGAYAVQIMIGVAEGLHFAHEMTNEDGKPLNIIHRDVSPQNIFISFDGTIKILDFGIAKAEQRSIRTNTGGIKGKYPYLSPEQVRSEVVDRRSDIFALGTVLWETTVGRRLFKRDNDLLTLQAVAHCEVPSPSEFMENYPPELEAIVMRALAADRENRYQSCRDLQEDLEQFISQYDLVLGPQRLGTYAKELFHDEPQTIRDILDDLERTPESQSYLDEESSKSFSPLGAAESSDSTHSKRVFITALTPSISNTDSVTPTPSDADSSSVGARHPSTTPSSGKSVPQPPKNPKLQSPNRSPLPTPIRPGRNRPSHIDDIFSDVEGLNGVLEEEPPDLDLSKVVQSKRPSKLPIPVRPLTTDDDLDSALLTPDGLTKTAKPRSQGYGGRDSAQEDLEPAGLDHAATIVRPGTAAQALSRAPTMVRSAPAHSSPLSAGASARQAPASDRGGLAEAIKSRLPVVIALVIVAIALPPTLYLFSILVEGSGTQQEPATIVDVQWPTPLIDQPNTPMPEPGDFNTFLARDATSETGQEPASPEDASAEDASVDGPTLDDASTDATVDDESSVPSSTKTSHQFAQLRVTTRPDNLPVEIDGHRWGRSPIDATLSPGEHRVVTNWRSVHRSIEVFLSPGEKAQRHIVVPAHEPQPQQQQQQQQSQQKGSLSLIIRPWADVFIDGRRVGLTPMPPVELTPGRHSVRLVNSALNRTVSRSVNIQPGERTTLSVDMNSAP